MSTRRTALSAAVLAGVLALAGCGSAAGAGAGNGSAAGASAPAAAPFNAADVAFAQGMRPHHEQAVEMSDAVLAAEPGPRVRALAQRVKAAQEPEIVQLTEMLEAFGVDGDASGHGGHGDPAGMMSEREMAALEDASGAEADRRYLEGMLEHHRGAVAMAETELAEGEHPPARRLAQQVKTDQEREIAEIEALLAG